MEEQKDSFPVVGCMVFVLIVCGIFYLISLLPGNVYETDSQQKRRLVDARKTAISISKQVTKTKLKAPASAQFPVDGEKVFDLSNGIYEIHSYVDSQNTFGAMLRAKYYCKLRIVDSRNFEVLDFKLYE